MKKFQDKVVMITGASSGIGEALAYEFANQGAHLALVARRQDRLHQVQEKIKAQGGEVLVLTGDVTRDGDMEGAVARSVEKFGRLDVVVANAGFGVVGPVGDLKLEDFRRQFETNVFGVLRTIYAALPELKKSRGTLALMGSVSGYVSAPQGAPYGMSKYAIRALAESLYAELAPMGIAVVLISPGFVQSEIYQVTNQGAFNPKQKNPVPDWLRMPTDKAARQMVGAIARRRREKIITWHGKALVAFRALTWGLIPRMFRMAANRLDWARKK